MVILTKIFIDKFIFLVLKTSYERTRHQSNDSISFYFSGYYFHGITPVILVYILA